jgi:hypothetical protein
MRPQWRTGLIVGLYVMLQATQGIAQIPDTFENLQVLDKNIEKRALIDTMRNMALGLGVRCNYCHVGEDSNDLQSHDWPSDDKRTKRVAREMLKMVHVLNDQYIAPIVQEGTEPVRVSCVTCHRGQPRPRLLEDVLDEELTRGGVDSLVARYTELRARYYGRHTFDFSEDVLTDMAQELIHQGDPKGAARLATMNLEYYPEHSVSYIVLGQISAQQGDKQAALDYLQRALQFQSNERMKRRIRGMIAEIESN